LTFSKLFPSHETVLEHAIIELELPIENKSLAGSSDEVGVQDVVTIVVYKVEELLG